MNKKEIDFVKLLKKTLHKFFTNLSKNPKFLKKVYEIKETLDIQETSKTLCKEFSETESYIFTENYENIFNLNLFNNKLILHELKDTENVIKYLRLIYIYSLGCQNKKEGKELMTKHKKILKGENRLVHSGIQVDENLTKDYPVIGDIFKDICDNLGTDISKIDTSKIDISNPIGSIMSSGIDITKLASVIPVLEKKIRDCDVDQLGKEIAGMIKKSLNKK